MSSSSPLVLDHVIGGNRLVYAHPTVPNVFIHAIGSVCVVTDMKDLHNQQFFRQHDEDISAICVSQHILVTGQFGTRGTHDPHAPICVWSLKSNELLYTLRKHMQGVRSLAISQDERFVISGGDDNLICVWDLKTGTLLSSQSFTNTVTSVGISVVEQQGPTSTATTHKGAQFRRASNPSYTVFAASGSNIYSFEVSFSVASQSYTLSRPDTAGLPSTGFVRAYKCLSIIGNDVVAGTESGEIVIYSLQNKVYRMHRRTTSGTVKTLCGNAGQQVNQIVVGGGHGTIVLLEGRDTRYDIVDQVDLPCGGDIHCISQSSPTTFAILSSRGCVYTFDTSQDPSTISLVLQSPISPLTNCLFLEELGSDLVCVTSPVDIQLWDLNEYERLLSIDLPTSEITSAAFGLVVGKRPDDEKAAGVRIAQRDDEAKKAVSTVPGILVGMKNGEIRGYDVKSGELMWKFSAHRGSVSSLTIARTLILSGGEDGAVRCWSSRTLEKLCEFADHSKRVTSVLFDNESVSMGHSCSLDRCVQSYEFEEDKKVNMHQKEVGGFTALVQKKDGERELITGSVNGVVSVWDCDCPDSVFAFDIKACICSMSLSGNGKYLAIGTEFGDVLLFATADFKIVLPPASVLRPSARAAPQTYSTKLSSLAPCFDSRGHAHSGPVSSLQWTPDCKQLISVGEDSGIFIWNCFDD
ncbi:putative WD repeat protein [Blattamonas nauphoetae]|uniref:Cilia- and flagella-associated protein 52 n=1 Tax=Blattamonas nauphoetae TaxID=2049346 RepID=A0ABQ9XWI4_9EUKA|nr:putative WD repeat protein [Blattamonas nauphoetae]